MLGTLFEQNNLASYWIYFQKYGKNVTRTLWSHNVFKVKYVTRNSSIFLKRKIDHSADITDKHWTMISWFTRITTTRRDGF